MKRSPEKQNQNSSETVRNEETVTSSSSETSPNASSSGLQATLGKRRRTGIKTAYSFYCDQVLEFRCVVFKFYKRYKRGKSKGVVICIVGCNSI